MRLSTAQKEIKKLIESKGTYKIESKKTVCRFSSTKLKRFGYVNADVTRKEALVGFSFQGIDRILKDDKGKKEQIRKFFTGFRLGQGREPEEGEDWIWYLKRGKREGEEYVFIINSELVKKVYVLGEERDQNKD